LMKTHPPKMKPLLKQLYTALKVSNPYYPLAEDENAYHV
jgi:hypothetical protein